MRAHFVRGQDPKDAMNTGHPEIRFAEFMMEKENELKAKTGGGPIHTWWESYSGDFWDDLKINHINDKKKYLEDPERADLETWKKAYNLDKDRALIQKNVLQRLLTLDEMPDDIDKWLWPGHNKRFYRGAL